MEPEFVCPITLELKECEKKDRQAVLVEKDKDSCLFSYADLSSYNPEKHIGAYLIGELPLSRVRQIYFDTQDDLDMFSRPSPDYWYPTDKYALLPEGFTEELFIEPNEDEILKACGLTRDEIAVSFIKRERERAAILNLINGTSSWQYGRYLFNMDYSLQQFLGLKDEALSAVLPHYTEARNNSNLESIALIETEKRQSSDFNQVLYNHIRSVLINEPFNNQKQPELIQTMLLSISERSTAECRTPAEANVVRRIIGEIVKLVKNTSDKGPEEIMRDVPDQIDVLKALLFVAKNPNRYDLFLESLDAYHADLLTKRRAAVLWGYLNGLYGMPGEGFNKDNQQLWQFIEAYVNDQETCNASLVVEAPETSVNVGRIFGIALTEEKIITAGEIRNVILATPKEKLSDEFYRKLLEAAEVEAGGKKKAEKKGYTHFVASAGIPEIRKGDELNADIKKILDQLLRDCKTPVPKKEKLFADYVMDEARFSFVFDLDKDYWRRLFEADLVINS